MLKDTVDRHERKIEELEKELESINRREEIKRILADQSKGITPYLLEIMKYLVAIIFVLIAKDKAMQIKWVAELIS